MKLRLFGIIVIITILVIVDNLNIRLSQNINIQNDQPTRENAQTEKNYKNKTEIEPETDQEVSTLVEVPVTYTTGISYYYPYFYKARLISFSEDSNIFFNPVISDVFNNTCKENCDICSNTKEKNSKNNTKDLDWSCLKCSPGYYLNEGQCVEYCPSGKLADILRAKCLESEMSSKIDIVYTMAYSVGSCNNMCGKVVQDCSCATSCKSKGNCCTNYDVVNCDFIIEKGLKSDLSKCKSSGCDMCEENSSANADYLSLKSIPTYKCTQCANDKFLHDGTCVPSCPEGFVSNFINRVCIKDSLGCYKSISNCDMCIQQSSDSNLLCKKCKRGNFLHNNQCVEICPIGFRADRITWSCLQPPVFGWYWVYPSTTTCRNKCNLNESKTASTDCSCIKECIREGSCCPDYDFYCSDDLFYRKETMKNQTK